MSDFHGPLSAIGGPIVDAVAAHGRLLPDQKNQRVVSTSAAALGWWACLAPIGLSGDGLLLGLWAGGGATALLSLIAAFKAASGLRSWLTVLWRGLLVVLCMWLLVQWNQPTIATFDREPGPYLVNALLIGWLCANTARCLLAAGLWQRSALRKIERQLRRQNAPMMPVRRH